MKIVLGIVIIYWGTKWSIEEGKKINQQINY